jgi:DNA-binding Xre family transcriptional regulator
MLTDNIKEICLDKNVDYNNLMKELGYNSSQLLSWDEEESIQLSDLVRISLVLKVDPNIFIGAKDESMKQTSDTILLQYINCITQDELDTLQNISIRVGVTE